MKSVIICEGPDDFWFLAYYLNKKASWDDCLDSKRIWSNYEIPQQTSRQTVGYYCKGIDNVAIWNVSGKDSIPKALDVIFNKLIADYPFDPIESIVIVRDRDNDSEEDILCSLQKAVGCGVTLINKESSDRKAIIDGYQVITHITPIIIPVEESGAIETVLLNSIKEKSHESSIVVEEACKYVQTLVDHPSVGVEYLHHEGEVIKAKFASAIAVTNPRHSTALFKEMIMCCPWETSESVAKNFDPILKAVTTF